MNEIAPPRQLSRWVSFELDGMNMKRAILILCVAAPLALSSIDGFACTCSLPWSEGTLKQQVNKARKSARTVFYGRVLKIDEAPYSVKVIFKVEGSWKRTLPTEIIIGTGRGGGDCGYHFEVGQDYLVYAFGTDDAHLGTNSCQRTKPLSADSDELRILGKPKRPVQ